MGLVVFVAVILREGSLINQINFASVNDTNKTHVAQCYKRPVDEMRMNAKGTVGSFGGRKLIYNKIITRKKIWGGGGQVPWSPPRSASG